MKNRCRDNRKDEGPEDVRRRGGGLRRGQEICKGDEN
jgi:hypothetical protein